MRQATPTIALAGWGLFLALALGLRAVIHRRRTGKSPFVGLRPRVGSAQWVGGAMFVSALGACAAAPLLALAGIAARVATPIAAMDRLPFHAAGVLLYGLGLAGTLWAQLAMGDSWRVGVERTERTTLVASGPFRWVRNPIFTAMSVAALGLTLLVPSPISLVAVAVLVLALEVHVRRVEEPYLTETHGESYRRYAARTGRFVPGIGRGR